MGMSGIDEKAMMLQALEAVSYTHLDVYKRQAQQELRFLRVPDAG